MQGEACVVHTVADYHIRLHFPTCNFAGTQKEGASTSRRHFGLAVTNPPLLALARGRSREHARMWRAAPRHQGWTGRTTAAFANQPDNLIRKADLVYGFKLGIRQR